MLFDADKLDSIGAVGVGRAFLFAGEIGARLHDKHIDVPKTKPYTRDDTAYREFLVKLGRVRDRMTTREGRRIAVDRHRFDGPAFSPGSTRRPTGRSEMAWHQVYDPFGNGWSFPRSSRRSRSSCCSAGWPS